MSDWPAILRDFYAALRQQDGWAASALMSQDASHQVFAVRPGAPFEGAFEGRAAIAAHFSRQAMAWTVQALDVDELEFTSNAAQAIVRATCVDNRSGSTLTTRECHVFRLSDEGIAQFDVFFESAPSAPKGHHAPWITHAPQSV
ncbi:MAG: nuclear transport factor 2 family protein [Pseudomonadota bacterium]